ncbi:MAG: hypothetical protein M3404_12690 [Actinomycetota bacterium]|nr:hypothetical protein [Actinomycetota bacterium]
MTPGARSSTRPTRWFGRKGLVPAGYTYLGQFIDHDITFDPMSSLDRLNDPTP